MERFNGMLKEYMRHFVSANQKNWAQLLDAAQFYFNSQKSSATNKSPFKYVRVRTSSAPSIACPGLLVKPMAACLGAFLFIFSHYVSSCILMFPSVTSINENKALYIGVTSQRKVGLAY